MCVYLSSQKGGHPGNPGHSTTPIGELAMTTAYLDTVPLVPPHGFARVATRPSFYCVPTDTDDHVRYVANIRVMKDFVFIFCGEDENCKVLHSLLEKCRKEEDEENSFKTVDLSRVLSGEGTSGMFTSGQIVVVNLFSSAQSPSEWMSIVHRLLRLGPCRTVFLEHGDQEDLKCQKFFGSVIELFERLERPEYLCGIGMSSGIEGLIEGSRCNRWGTRLDRQILGYWLISESANSDRVGLSTSKQHAESIQLLGHARAVFLSIGEERMVRMIENQMTVPYPQPFRTIKYIAKQSMKECESRREALGNAKEEPTPLASFYPYYADQVFKLIHGQAPAPLQPNNEVVNVSKSAPSGAIEIANAVSESFNALKTSSDFLPEPLNPSPESCTWECMSDSSDEGYDDVDGDDGESNLPLQTVRGDLLLPPVFCLPSTERTTEMTFLVD